MEEKSYLDQAFRNPRRRSFLNDGGPMAGHFAQSQADGGELTSETAEGLVALLPSFCHGVV